MDELKFKIWDEERKVMYKEGSEEATDALVGEFEEDVAVMGLTFSKYPGKKYLVYVGMNDKNDKEYCSGDIVKVNKLSFESSAPLPENLVVRYYGGMFQLFRGAECLMGLHLNYIEDGEIIGNIYENPELISSEGN